MSKVDAQSSIKNALDSLEKLTKATDNARVYAEIASSKKTNSILSQIEEDNKHSLAFTNDELDVMLATLLNRNYKEHATASENFISI